MGRAKGHRVWIWNCSYFSGAAERRDGKECKDYGDDDGKGDEPVGGVAGPGAEGGVEPGDGEDSEDCAGHFVKELFEYAPETAETALLGRVMRGTGS
jgi:hypothetical protein